jgi:ABC-type phosphate transport system auxiliary subunit
MSSKLTKSDIQVLDKLLDQKLDSVKSDLELSIDKKLDEKFDLKLKPIHTNLNKLNNKIDLVARVLDRDYVHLRKRVGRVEDHLDLPALPSDY